MFRLAMLILQDEDLARDTIHDVFETLLRAGKRDVAEAYLLKAVRNHCFNHLRSLSTRERIKQLYALEETEIGDEEWPDEETLAILHSSVSNDLTEACRRVVTMRFTDGMKYKEIAAALNISEVAVYKHLRHAIDVIRKKLNDHGQD